MGPLGPWVSMVASKVDSASSPSPDPFRLVLLPREVVWVDFCQSWFWSAGAEEELFSTFVNFWGSSGDRPPPFRLSVEAWNTSVVIFICFRFIISSWWRQMKKVFLLQSVCISRNLDKKLYTNRKLSRSPCILNVASLSVFCSREFLILFLFCKCFFFIGPLLAT